MPNPAERRRYYLTTAIAYPNNAPGLHTLYEVIAADVIARWHRMTGDDTRFLTGTDEHSVNIAMAAADRGQETRAFVDQMVQLFKDAEDALGIAPDRFIRTTDEDHRRASVEMVRRAHRNGDVYPGDYEGWYCPAEGFKASSDLVEDAQGVHCPNHPNVTLQWLKERNWFFRLSAYQERLLRHYKENPEWVQPEYRRNEMLGFIRSGLEDFSISRQNVGWGIPFPIREDGSDAVLPDGSADPAAGTIYVWFDALTNYLTGAGFPDDKAAFDKWWPADLHVIGKDIARFHTISWPAMLMSAGLDLPRLVWVHGFMHLQGEKMSKSRGNFFDPNDMVRALGSDGARYVTLREVPFDRDSDVSWDTFLRTYNADLANNFGNLVNRTVTMAQRYLDAKRPSVGEDDKQLADTWTAVCAAYGDHIEHCRPHDALEALGLFVQEANRFVDAQQPWVLAKRATQGDAAAQERLAGALGDLIEACRVIGLASAPFLPETAPRVLAQLGYDYPYGPDGNGGPPLRDELRWGARSGEKGSVGTPEPLFPRLELGDADAPAKSGASA